MYKIAFLFLFIISQGVSSQNKEFVISFKKEEKQGGIGRFVQTTKEEMQGQIKGIPDSLASLCGLYSITLDPSIIIPEDRLGYEYYKRNKVFVFVAVNKEKEKRYVIVDTNTNYDFSDDKLYTFPLQKADEDYEEVIIPIETVVYTAQGSFPTSVNLLLDPFDKTRFKDYFLKNKTEDERLLEPIFRSSYHLASSEIINNYQVNFIALPPQNNLLQQDLNKSFRLDFEVPDDPAYYKLAMGVRLGDTVSIANRNIVFEKIYQNNLFLKDVGISTDSAGVSKYLPALYGVNLEGMQKVVLNELTENKFVFIDFWGSWCKPCIESLPKLVELYEKVKDREDVVITGLALDIEGDVEKLKNIIQSENCQWLNLWIDRKEWSLPSNAFKKMRVNAFPTYVIVDKSGRICYRNLSSFNVEEAIEFFLKLINEQ